MGELLIPKTSSLLMHAALAVVDQPPDMVDGEEEDNTEPDGPQEVDQVEYQLSQKLLNQKLLSHLLTLASMMILSQILTKTLAPCTMMNLHQDVEATIPKTSLLPMHAALAVGDQPPDTVDGEWEDNTVLDGPQEAETLELLLSQLLKLTLAKMMTPSSMMKVIHALMVMMLIQNTAEPSIPKTSSLLMHAALAVVDQPPDMVDGEEEDNTEQDGPQEVDQVEYQLSQKLLSQKLLSQLLTPVKMTILSQILTKTLAPCTMMNLHQDVEATIPKTSLLPMLAALAEVDPLPDTVDGEWEDNTESDGPQEVDQVEFQWSQWKHQHQLAHHQLM